MIELTFSEHFQFTYSHIFEIAAILDSQLNRVSNCPFWTGTVGFHVVRNILERGAGSTIVPSVANFHRVLIQMRNCMCKRKNNYLRSKSYFVQFVQHTMRSDRRHDGIVTLQKSHGISSMIHRAWQSFQYHCLIMERFLCFCIFHDKHYMAYLGPCNGCHFKIFRRAPSYFGFSWKSNNKDYWILINK